jgi:nucleoside-diphosphate-sugar epimerase
MGKYRNKKKKVLVTGGAGFIGSNLVEQLVKNENEVIVIDNLCRGNKLTKDVMSSITLIKDDIKNIETIMDCCDQCDLIYNFAAVLGVDIVADNPIETMETDIHKLSETQNPMNLQYRSNDQSFRSSKVPFPIVPVSES